MNPLVQYGLLLGIALSTAGLVAMIYLIARSFGKTREEPGKDVPFTGGTFSPKPVWARYHAHYYGFALLFLAFDMEMAYMYPWAVVFQEVGVSALADMGVFLTILFLGLLYGWSQGALKRQ
ncbi:MAG: NADH-quinone oxidoreductase subunit A [Thermomicrobiales bacterium]